MAINYTGTTNRSEFTYDGLSRCVKIVEKTNGSVTSTRKFVWCGMEKCEFRDAGDAVTDFIYPQGQYSGTTKYFYFRDHLGSIREMMRSNGTVVARFDYDPWGRSTTVLNTTLPDFNFTGLYRHSASNLDLAVYRAYDPDLGRWLSRDPIEERGGVNLYSYTGNRVANAIDRDGLDAIVVLASKSVAWQGHIAILVGDNVTGWSYYSRNGYGAGPYGFGTGDNVLRTYPRYEDFLRDSRESGRYNRAYHIQTTPDEDLAMTAYGDEHYRDAYHSIVPPSNNCADLVEEVLEAGGHSVLGYNQYPLSVYGVPVSTPEVPNILFGNLLRSHMGRLWNRFP